MKKILVFTGAGISSESGIETFRGSGGLWSNYKIEDIATPSGWKKNKELVLNFYNERRRKLKEVLPNDAHKMVAKLEERFQVLTVTQNIDDLHERAGSSNIIHLHGELKKSRSILNSNLIYDIGYNDIKIGDKCELGSQLRPHIVWFEENLNEKDIKKSMDFAKNCDYCIIIGTSLVVYPAYLIPFNVKENVPIYYIDPGDLKVNIPSNLKFKHIKKIASIGLDEIMNYLI